MGAYNPVLNGIMRGMQLASLIQGQRIRQQNAQSLEGARQEMGRRNAALEARQGELDVERAQEKSREFQLKAREAGAAPFDSGQSEQFRRGEDFSVELAPGMATTASASAIEGPGGGLFAWPGPVEKGALDLDKRLTQVDAEEQIRTAEALKRREPPLPARVQDDEGNVNFLDPRTGKTLATAKGVGKKSGAKLGETPAEKRARANFERSIADKDNATQVESWANRLLDEAGDVDAALADVERQARFNPFVKDNRIAIVSEIKKARLSGALDQTNALLQELLGGELPGGATPPAGGIAGHGARGNGTSGNGARGGAGAGNSAATEWRRFKQRKK